VPSSCRSATGTGMTNALLAALQFADGLFPAGGFAHSLGLETYVQDGVVRDRAGLEELVAAHLEGSAGPADAVAVAAGVRIAAEGDVPAWIGLDERLEAMKPVPETREASRQMGRQTLRVAAALGPDAFLTELARAVDDGLAPGHHAAVFGAALGRAGVVPELAAAAYLHSTAALLVGAGLRLIALGQLDGQRVLAAMRPRIARLASVAADAGPADMWSFNPGLELAGLRHATLESRLFRS
jgi:urease accessory protein